MLPQGRSVSVAPVLSLGDRIRMVKRESRRDLASVAVAVAVGGVLWFLLPAIGSLTG
jgi:hypothetical protein